MSTFFARYVGIGGGGGGGGVTSLDGLTGALTLVAGTGISIVDGVSTITIASTSAGDLTLTAFGSTPNNAGASLSGQALTLQPADATHPGGVSTTTQSFGGNKTFTGTIAASNLSGTNTGDLVLGTANGLSLIGQVLSLGLASSSTTGALSSIDWITFNSKQSALTLTNLTDAGTDGITITNGTGAVIGASPVTISQHVADSTHNGYLSSTDWSTFNSKQTAGNYITALTGDGTATGPGSVALTLATVNSNVGTFASVTVNGKGLVTAAAALSGDATTSGAVLTLASVNGNVGSFGNQTSIPAFTVNAKGLITAASALPAASPYELLNYSLFPSQAAGALTVAIRDATGSANPSATSPVKMQFINPADLVTGGLKELSLTGSSSVVAPSGSTLGLVSAATSYVYVYALDSNAATTIEVAISAKGDFDEAVLQTTTAITSGATSATVLYSTSARSNRGIRLIGRLLVVNTAGTWSTPTAAYNGFITEKLDKATLTAKGSLISASAAGTPAEVLIGANNTLPIADSAQTSGIRWANLSQSKGYINGSIATSVASNALTIALKDAAGADASSTSVIAISFRNSTASTGTYNVRTVTGALSTVISSGSTANFINAVEGRIYVYLIDNAGTVELAWSGTLYDEGSLVTTTAEGGGGGADSDQPMYSTTARSNVPFRLIGRFKATEATSGTWATTPSEVTNIPFKIYKTPTIQSFTAASGTYTTPPGVIYLKVKLVGGGGGGAGSGTGSGGNGGTGGNTTFGSSLLTGAGGTGGFWNAGGGAGGSATINSSTVGAIGVAVTGSSGQSASYSNVLNTGFFAGAAGGNSPYFCGGGASSFDTAAGSAGVANTGGGGQGGGSNGVTASVAGSGGGSGGFVDAILPAPLATSYAWAIGISGTSGTAGTSGLAGGAGAAGYIIVEEHYY